MTKFTELGLADPLTRALAEEGYERPTPIQAQAIPPLLMGRDLLGVAQTGTGKTAAFALPLLQRLTAPTGSSPAARAKPGRPRVLILTPTRELAIQIRDSFKTYGRHVRLSTAVIFGGVGQGPQVDALRRGADVVVATPGRLIDLMEQRHLTLDGLEAFVLDEADRLLDMGFIHEVRKITRRLPAKRQTLLFSATMPREVTALAESLLTNPARVSVTPQATTVERIDQRLMFVAKADKRALLLHLLEDAAINRAIVFTRTKHAANKLAQQLERDGVRADAIHGNKSQGARQRALEGFRAGDVRVLVATDIAARGIDVDGISHVVNFDLPDTPEAYVHRIGRTARAGAEGRSISFCDAEETGLLRDVEKTIRQAIPVDAGHPFHAAHGAGPRVARPARGGQAKPQSKNNSGRRRRRNRGQRKAA